MMNMKCAVWIGVFMILFQMKSEAQLEVGQSIDPVKLAITNGKTTHIIFPFAIKSVDKGTQDVLVQKAIGVENVLQVRAGKPGFTETNLTVITSDGSLFSYVLSYAPMITTLNVLAGKPQVRTGNVAVFKEEATTDKIQQAAELVAGKSEKMKGVSKTTSGISLAMTGLYIHDEVCYLRITLENSSVIGYDLQMLRLYIMDKKRSKRTASQEVVIEPVFIYRNTKRILPGATQDVVIAVPKFTISDKKHFVLSMQEAGGGRHLEVRIGNKTLMRAKRIIL